MWDGGPPEAWVEVATVAADPTAALLDAGRAGGFGVRIDLGSPQIADRLGGWADQIDEAVLRGARPTCVVLVPPVTSPSDDVRLAVEALRSRWAPAEAADRPRPNWLRRLLPALSEGEVATAPVDRTKPEP